MVANKYTRKEIILFCDEVTNILSELKINEKSKENIKKYEKLNKQSEKCKKIIDGSKKDKSIRNRTNYNNYIEDCFLIKKGVKSSGILPKDVEKELKNDINNHDNKNFLSLFGNYWKNKINEEIKNKYKNNEHPTSHGDKTEKHRGRPKKNINNNN